jgi:hypothetical protein
VFSLSVHENTSVNSQRLSVATGIIVCLCRYNWNASVRCLRNSLPMYALLCERVYNCHLDNGKENLVTEPLSRNGRPLRFRYNPVLAARHIAPSLRLFVPNSLKVYHRSFSSEGCACNVFFFFLTRCFLLFFFFRIEVTTLQLLPPPPPYVRLSRAAPDIKSYLSLSVVGATDSTIPFPAPFAVPFSVLEGANPSTRSNP